MDYQNLFLENLPLIEGVVDHVARKHRLSPQDREEFLSLVHDKLLDRDFAVLRKFQARSSLGTYLTTVAERIYLDSCITRWGKWRSSSAARRLGTTALLLERLVGRDGLTFAEAVGTLQTNYGVKATREQLHDIWVQLPTRATRRPTTEVQLSPITGPANDQIQQAEDEQLATAIASALERAISALPAQERLLVRWRFYDGKPLAQIERELGLRTKSIYRQLEDVIRHLRDHLQREGVRETQIDQILAHPTFAVRDVLESVGRPSAMEDGHSRPSNQ